MMKKAVFFAWLFAFISGAALVLAVERGGLAWWTLTAFALFVSVEALATTLD